TGGIDDVEEYQRGRRHAAVTVAFAERKLHHFVVEPALHAQPFVAQSAAREERCRKPERLRRLLDPLRRRRRLWRLSPQVTRPEPGQTARDDARTPCARID